MRNAFQWLAERQKIKDDVRRALEAQEEVEKQQAYSKAKAALVAQAQSVEATLATRGLKSLDVGHVHVDMGMPAFVVFYAIHEQFGLYEVTVNTKGGTIIKPMPNGAKSKSAKDEAVLPHEEI